MPILTDHGATAAFFVPTQWIGTSLERDRDLILSFYAHGKTAMEFLDWDDCRAIASAGMIVGSHTVSHPRLLDLSAEEVEWELRASKEAIERELGQPCDHFCAPTGRPGIDFDPDRDPAIAERLGYRSFLTTRRGSFRRQSSPMMVERDHTVAIWSRHQLRYFFSQ